MDDNVEQFNAVTGNSSLEVAKFFLESANNGLAEAINTYMESGGAVPADITQGAAAEDMTTDDPVEEAPKMSVTADDKGDEEQRRALGRLLV